MSQSRDAGFAMLDVLVALLLLAAALTGACVMLVDTMRATHGALLATRAVDLAADLTEELQGSSSAAQAAVLLAAWRARVASVLPVSGMAADEFASLLPLPAQEAGLPAASGYQLTLRWHAPQGRGMRELKLPVAAAPGGALP